MIETETMPSMDNLMDRQKLVGWIVRDCILSSDYTFTESANRWHMSLPTLNRLMSTGNVGVKFYRQAERNLGLPSRLLEMVVDGDTDAIAALPDLEEPLRSYILTELGVKPEATKKTGRGRARNAG